MITEFFLSNVSYWPLAVFIALFLAGFNLPISEDALIIASAAICQEKPELLVPTLVFLYFGIVLSDLLCYFWGFLVSKGLSGFKFVRKILESNKKTIIMNRLEKTGFITFVTIRFIPFGMRNALFISSGFFHLKLWKFILFDWIAALISSQTLFWLIFCLGESSSLWQKLICAALLVVLLSFVFHTVKGIRNDLRACPPDSASEQKQL